jgi:hypothetical protein
MRFMPRQRSPPDTGKFGAAASWRLAKNTIAELTERPGAMPANLVILVHFSASSAMHFMNLAAVIGT